MLKRNLESLDGVDESLHSYYEESDNGFKLKLDGDDDSERYKHKHSEAEKHRKAAESKKDELERELRELKEAQGKAKDDQHRNSGDVEALDKSWSEKFTAREQELSGEIEQMTGSINSLLVDSAAAVLASSLAAEGSGKVLLPHIKSRLKAVKGEDGSYKTAIFDAEGKPSALTIEDLEKEFRSDPAFAGVIAGSKASGGGASGGSDSGGAGGRGSNTKADDAKKAGDLSGFIKATLNPNR